MHQSLKPCARRPLTSMPLGFLFVFLFLASILPAPILYAAGEGKESPLGKNLPEGTPSIVAEAADLVRSSLTAPDAAARKKVLDKAQNALEAFLRDNPTHADAPLVEMQLGAVLTAAAKGYAADAQIAETPDTGEKLLDVSRQTFLKAEEYFATALDQFRTSMKMSLGFPGLGSPTKSPEMLRREHLKGNLIQAMMYQAGVREELAATYPVESPEARESYKAAADRYEQIYKDYRTLLAGLVARLKQGQCYKQLGDTRRALGLYNDLLTQPEELQALHRLRVAAMYLSLECWTTEQEKLYELAFSQGEEYLTHLKPEEKTWPEWQAVRYFTAQGYRLAALGLPAATRGDDRRAWLVKACEHAQTLADEAGPYKAAAAELAAESAKLQRP